MERRIQVGALRLDKGDRQYIDEALDASRISMGPKVREFERRFSRMMGIPEAIATSSARLLRRSIESGVPSCSSLSR